MSFIDNLVKAWNDLFAGTVVDTPEAKEARLDTLASKSSEHLDWRNSIVDLMKLTGQDSSLHARAKLAKELGYTGIFTGTTNENLWLHLKVMEHLKV